jgi:ribosomal protein S18 acetylase RimI-like enzyme
VTAYRFCRTDDVPLLVQAHNACYSEPTGNPPIAVEDFKRWMRELDVWCSSCMVAFEGGEPVGVLIGAKRAHASLIHRIGVKPDHRRRGHARHMLESLARKMAILEPRTLLVEVPSENEAALRLFEACGYEAGEVLVDWVADSVPPPASSGRTGVRGSGGSSLLGEVTWTDLEASGALRFPEPCPWSRSAETLRAMRDRLQGLAFVSDLGFEAWLLYSDGSEDGNREIVALGGTERAPLLHALLAESRLTEAKAVLVPRVNREGPPPDLLRSAGFRVLRRTSLLTAH